MVKIRMDCIKFKEGTEEKLLNTNEELTQFDLCIELCHLLDLDYVYSEEKGYYLMDDSRKILYEKLKDFIENTQENFYSYTSRCTTQELISLEDIPNVKGYGADINLIYDWLDSEKIAKAYYGDTLTDKERTYVKATLTGYLQGVLEKQESLLIYACSYRKGGYVLIRNVHFDDMHHKDYEKVRTEDAANEYIWEHLKPFLKDNLKKESFIEILKPILDKTIA
jgi:hypothetical protein